MVNSNTDIALIHQMACLITVLQIQKMEKVCVKLLLNDIPSGIPSVKVLNLTCLKLKVPCDIVVDILI